MPKNNQHIIIRGARVHNLKNITVRIPRNRLVVLTGLSGSGKSSLAFDTLYAEGQRRYVESLSAYARQFLGQMDKPDCDSIEGLSPAISIDQKAASHNPRSTVATITEIHDHLRLLFARIGHPHCYQCGKPIAAQAVEQMVDEIMALPQGTRFYVLSSQVRGRKGEHQAIFESARRSGFTRVIVDDIEYRLDEEIPLNKNKQHTIDIVIDRLVINQTLSSRLNEALETAFSKSDDGLVKVRILPDGKETSRDLLFSQKLACPDCGISYEELSPRMFSFNSPYGRCSTCDGLGFISEVDPELVVSHPQLSINEGAIAPWRDTSSEWVSAILRALSKRYKIDLDKPYSQLSYEQQRILLYGSGDEEVIVEFGDERFHRSRRMRFSGVLPIIERGYHETSSDSAREFYYGRFIARKDCPDCRGMRLKPAILGVTISRKNIGEVTALSVERAMEFLGSLKLNPHEQIVAKEVLKEIRARLQFMMDVGLSYLTLDRMAPSLAGGEVQRIRLATQIGSGLVGVLYILDEPTIGLHQRDTKRLLVTLKKLRDLGNTVVLVEHDRETINQADWVIDLGPGAGVHGGELVAEGTPLKVSKCSASLTGRYLSGKEFIPIPEKRRAGDGRFLEIVGASEHNLKNIDVRFPLGAFICVTGVSGSGKSTLVDEILYRILARVINHSPVRPGSYRAIYGLDNIDKVIEVDQSPIGRTPRSNPATYTGAFTHIRNLFAMLAESRVRGYQAGRFSFNVAGGRCEACQGDGYIKVEMHFLPDVYITCQVCKGKRYNRETLEVRYKGKNIAEVLSMTIEEASVFFQNIPAVKRVLETLIDVGLGYLELGQPATTLSGGEAQRIKLARELHKRPTGKTIYILDEPTTGLHFEDVRKLLSVLARLCEGGNTVIVIEHNMEVIKTADYIIDLGREGGDAGGYIVATGSPEEVAKVGSSYTGKFLREVLALK